jgi:outer membrane protein assembly factor BamB
VKVTKKGTSFAAEEMFFTKDLVNQHGGMVLVDGHIYGSSDNGGFACIELATGTTKWRDRAISKGSVVAVDGRLITRSERGIVCLVNVSPEKAEIVGQFEPGDRSDAPSWPHPVVSDGKLYLRDQDVVQCYDLRT